MNHLDYLNRGDPLLLCPVGSAHMEKVKGHHFLFYFSAVINSFFHSHLENARKKAKGRARLMGEAQQGSRRIRIESTYCIEIDDFVCYRKK